MDLLAIENDIVSKLDTDITDLEIVGFLRDPEQFKAIGRKGGVLVSFDSDTYSEPEPNRGKCVHQIRTLSWNIVVVWRNSAGKHYNTTETESLYTYSEAVKTSLKGYTVPTDTNFSVLVPTGSNFVGERNGSWILNSVFTHGVEEYAAFQ